VQMLVESVSVECSLLTKLSELVIEVVEGAAMKLHIYV